MKDDKISILPNLKMDDKYETYKREQIIQIEEIRTHEEITAIETKRTSGGGGVEPQMIKC